MIKKFVATAAVAASALGASAAAVPQALAVGNDQGPSVTNGNAGWQSFGNSTTYGKMSPQIALIQGSFNKPCVALNDIPASANGAIGGAIQDVPILSDHMQQQCTENSSNVKRDGALAHLLEDVSVLSQNGEG